MIDFGVQNVEFSALNTDRQALVLSKAQTKIQIGDKITKGLGAGANQRLDERQQRKAKRKLGDF